MYKSTWQTLEDLYKLRDDVLRMRSLVTLLPDSQLLTDNFEAQRRINHLIDQHLERANRQLRQ